MKNEDLRAELIKRDQDITELNKIIETKNKEIAGDTTKQELAAVKNAYGDLANKHNVLISDVKNYLQLSTSGTELMSSNLNKAIQSLGPVRPPVRQ